MNKIFKVILAVTIIVIVAGTYRMCKVNERIAEIERDLRVARASAALADGEYKKVLKAATEEIGRLNVIIGQSEVVVTELEGDIAERDRILADLNDQLDSLPNEDTIVTLRKRVDILTNMVVEYADKYMLAERIIGEKDTQIFALSEKYDTEHIAHLKLQQSYNSLYEYNQALVRFNKELKIAYNRNRLTGTIKTAGLFAAGGVIIYTILKGIQHD